jgi:hypothetical protein
MSLPEAEFEATKDAADTLEEARFQNELARIGREWDGEREQYMVVGRRGRRYPPNATSTGGVVVVLIGILWAVGASVLAFFESGFIAGQPMGGGTGPFLPWILPCIGVLFIVFGIWVTSNAAARAQKNQEAEDAYKRRRAHLIATHGKPVPPDERFRAQ